MTGQVLWGINNIYTVEVDDRLIQCRIKGKVLKDEDDWYNPIAVGDLVTIQEDPLSREVGWIIRREERRSQLVRWNRKKRTPQVIAANIDMVVGVVSIKSPPFRPRFLDRLLVAAELEKLPALILVNKVDMKIKEDALRRIENYRALGYPVILCSVKTGEGIEEIKKAIEGKVPVFFGQSGVGKSSLLNTLAPELGLKTGEVSSKHNRGSHTTNFASLLKPPAGPPLIDTPGIREMYLFGVDVENLRFYFPELKEREGACAYPGCLHLDEPDCGVKKDLEKGLIHPDRYESYRRIIDSLEEMKDDTYRPGRRVQDYE